MRSKLLIVSLIAILLFSALNVAQAAVQCPRCHGSGKITSPTCPTCGGTGWLKPTITRKSISSWGSEPRARVATFVAGVFYNEGDVGVNGTATAEVKTPTATYTNTSSKIYFPPREDVTVTIIVEGVEYERYPSCMIYVSEVDNIACPKCGGTGTGGLYVAIDCPDCGGTGFVTALPPATVPPPSTVSPPSGAEDVTNFLAVGGPIVGVAVVAAVAVAAIVVVRKKRVTEQSLRKLPPSEFQNWVVQRFSGKASSEKDSRMGIDGYTMEGQPILIKQSDGIGMNVIDSFAAAIGKSKAKSGVIVAFSFSDDAIRGRVRAKLNYGLEIQMVTVKELIESRKRT